VARRLRPLTGDDVTRLPGSCGRCLVWELGTAGPVPRTPVVPAGAPREDPPTDPVARKRAWISAVVQASGPPGRVVLVDDEVVGYALFGPAAAFARRASSVPAVSPDAVLLATMWIAATHREGGLGRLLIHAAIKEALRLDAAAVEVYGDRRWREQACVLPAAWLLHEGFEVHREHPRTPLFRLDVRRTARWTGSLEHAVEEVLGRLPRPAPATSHLPGGAVTHRTHQRDP
jgi:GNAT superfamily N-acetyltransferase